jgi:hypothetical protein
LSPCHISYRGAKGRKTHKRKGAYAGVQWQATKVFAIKAKDLKLFAEEAKKYGVLYAAVVNKKAGRMGLWMWSVNANDAARVNRITERFALSTVECGKDTADIMKAREEKGEAGRCEGKHHTAREKEAHTVDENTLDAMRQ